VDSLANLGPFRLLVGSFQKGPQLVNEEYQSVQKYNEQASKYFHWVAIKPFENKTCNMCLIFCNLASTNKEICIN